ncbi:MAG: DUF4129 domain-containing protein [Candidatus Hodarchaeales archaeon]|jgi:hypothetical protein
MAIDPLLIILVVGGFGIGFAVWYFRESIMPQKARKTITEAQIEERLVQIRQLARQQNFRDASLLMWDTFRIGARDFLGVQRAPAQTARDMGMAVMTRSGGGLDPQSLNNIVSVFEKARYSNVPMTITEFNDALSGLHTFLQIATAMAVAAAGESAEVEA